MQSGRSHPDSWALCLVQHRYLQHRCGARRITSDTPSFATPVPAPRSGLFRSPISPRRQRGTISCPSAFRFWNVIHYFFPYKDLLDRPWDDVLPEFIPRFQAAGEELDYLLTVAGLAARTQDMHAFVFHKRLEQHLGTHYPPLTVRTVQGETVVTAILDDVASASLRVGDVVLAVDGEAIVDRRARLEPLMAASTPQALRWRVDRQVLAGREEDEAVLTIRDAGGFVREVRLSRAPAGEWQKSQSRLEKRLPVFGLLTPALGYMDLTRLTIDQVAAAFEAVKDTSATIMDMRGYPRGVFETLGSYLTDRRVTAALFHRPEWHGPDPDWGFSALQARQMIEPGLGNPYRGKVVVLINEDAISQSEHTCLWLEATTDVTFVGSPTNGANGDVTTTVLPGGIIVNFTGHDVRHGDGRQLQRIGILPHLHVEPTIDGIRQGRDEVLEAAISFLGEQVEQATISS